MGASTSPLLELVWVGFSVIDRSTRQHVVVNWGLSCKVFVLFLFFLLRMMFETIHSVLAQRNALMFVEEMNK